MSKQKNLLDTLIHLFERLTIENEDNHSNHTTTQEIQSGLLEAGYEKKQVNTMLDWLESFNAKVQKESDHIPFKVPQGFRILHEKEKAKIDADAIRYLLKLEQKKRLTPIMREFILSQVMKLDVPTVSLEQLKWILSMAKLNHENKEDTLEMLIYDLLNDTDEKKFSPILH